MSWQRPSCKILEDSPVRVAACHTVCFDADARKCRSTQKLKNFGSEVRRRPLEKKRDQTCLGGSMSVLRLMTLKSCFRWVHLQQTLNTRISTKKKRNILRLSGRYQLNVQKDSLSHFFPNLVPAQSVENLFWGWGCWFVEKNQLNWEGVWKCGGRWLVKSILSRINIELTCEERPKQVLCLYSVNTFCPTSLSLNCCFCDIVLSARKTASELLQFMVWWNSVFEEGCSNSRLCEGEWPRTMTSAAFWLSPG